MRVKMTPRSGGQVKTDFVPVFFFCLFLLGFRLFVFSKLDFNGDTQPLRFSQYFGLKEVLGIVGGLELILGLVRVRA